MCYFRIDFKKPIYFELTILLKLSRRITSHVSVVYSDVKQRECFVQHEAIKKASQTGLPPSGHPVSAAFISDVSCDGVSKLPKHCKRKPILCQGFTPHRRLTPYQQMKIGPKGPYSLVFH